jgi:threonine/homoserine/homoserine lactone efflux protein
MIERLIEFSLVYLSAIVSPGPNFIMVVRTGLSHSFYNGFALVLGLCFGSFIQICLALLGMEMVFSQYPGAIKIIQYSGAGFLVYMGLTSLFSKKKTPVLSSEKGISQENEAHFWKFFRIGIMTQLLNPFAIIFNWSVFVAFKSDILWINGVYMASALLIEFIWYAGLAWFLARPGFQKIFRGYHHWIERGAGALLIAIAFRIAFTKI